MRHKSSFQKTNVGGLSAGVLTGSVALGLVMLSLTLVQGQEPAAAAPPEPEIHTSGLGTEFIAVPGTAVFMGAWETRVSDFEKFVSETGYKWEHKPHFPQTGDHPVVNVTLQEAIAYCAWLTSKERAAGSINNLQSYRLPSNDEWSTAVGLTSVRKDRQTVTQEVEDKRAFPWGVEWPPPAHAGNYNSREINNTDDGYTYTSPVGVFSPNLNKIFDMGGNVWEWAWDQEVRAEAFGTLRGGSWIYFRKECLLSGYQYQVPAELRAPSVGFRCVFEDKHRTAVYLAAAAQNEQDADKQKRNMLATGPKVTEAEVEKMRQAMARNTSNQPTTKVRPDIKTLAPAKPGVPYTNSLGMVLRPVDEGSLLVAEHEVTIQNYQESLAGSSRTWPPPSFEWKDTYAVMNVTWQDAKAFCEWLTTTERAANLISATASYRLPTDAEWSLAAKLKEPEGTPAEKHGTNKADFPWGIEWPPPSLSANLDTAHMTAYQDNFSYTSPVGSFSPNANRLYDISGNVAEWCEDAWAPGSNERVIRGGSWLSSTKESLLSSARQHAPENTTRLDIGFRVVLQLDDKPQSE